MPAPISVTGASVTATDLTELVFAAGSVDLAAVAAAEAVWVTIGGTPTFKNVVGYGDQTNSITVHPAFAGAASGLAVTIIDPAVGDDPLQVTRRVMAVASDLEDRLQNAASAIVLRSPGGTANALTFTGANGLGGITTYVVNQTRLRFVPAAANTAAASASVDTASVLSILKGGGVALAAGDLSPVTEADMTVVQISGVNGGSPFWLLKNPATGLPLRADVAQSLTAAQRNQAAANIGSAADVVTVASATTTDIGVAASENILISGTTTIAGFGTVAAGVRRRVRFFSTPVLTHSASLILPGGVNITAGAGDSLEAISEGGGTWRVTDYQRANGEALVPGILYSRAQSLTAGEKAQAQANINGTGSVAQERVAVLTTRSGIDPATRIPLDNTKPQSNEGSQILSLSITPRSATNVLVAEFTCQASLTGLGNALFAIFDSNSADARGSHWDTLETASYSDTIVVRAYWTPGTTSAITVSVRGSTEVGNAAQLWINGTSGGDFLGGSLNAMLTVREITSP
jgi:hypothetical protein